MIRTYIHDIYAFVNTCARIHTFHAYKNLNTLKLHYAFMCICTYIVYTHTCQIGRLVCTHDYTHTCIHTLHYTTHLHSYIPNIILHTYIHTYIRMIHTYPPGKRRPFSFRMSRRLHLLPKCSRWHVTMANPHWSTSWACQQRAVCQCRCSSLQAHRPSDQRQ